MASEPQDITELLAQARGGDRDAENRLYEIVMPQLRRLAHHMLGGERAAHTLQGTELVNRVYVRLANAQLSTRDRAHFFAIAARAMRRELIDYARSRPKAGLVPIDEVGEGAFALTAHPETALTINELLDELRESAPEDCSIVELKYFLGMTDEETAEVLGMPLRTMQNRWQQTRIWLFEHAEAQQWQPKKRSSPAAAKPAK